MPLGLPLGLLLFCGVTMRTVAAFSDESMASYGFPIPWYAPSGTSSMAYVIAIGPLLVDLAIYLVLGQALLYLLPQRMALTLSQRKPVLASLWLAACLAVVGTGLALSIRPQLVAWSLDAYYGDTAQRSRGLHFGFGS